MTPANYTWTINLKQNGQTNWTAYITVRGKRTIMEKKGATARDALVGLAEKLTREMD